MEHHFIGLVDRQEDGFHYNHVLLPVVILAVFKNDGVKRIVCRVNGAGPFRRALISDGQGGAFLIFGKDMLQDAKATTGSRVQIDLWADPDPDAIDIPEEFAELMNQDKAVAAKFNAITPGRQRSLMIYITQAKSADTRLKRAMELGHKLVTNTLYGDRKVRV